MTTSYTYDHVFAAMCIMEEIASPVEPNMPTPWRDYRDQVGINQLREVIIERLAGPCDDAWERACDRAEAGVEEHADDCEATATTGVCTCGAHQKLDPGAFDYEFVPFWLRMCVDWSDTLNGPKVRHNPDR